MPTLKRRALCSFFLLFGWAVLGWAQEPKTELKFDIGAVDPVADPCTDFYQFACGGWRAHNPIPPDRAYTAVFAQMRKLNGERIQGILGQAARKRAGRSRLQQQIGDYYASCMDTEAIDARGLAPLAPELKRIDAVDSPEALAVELARLHRMGSDALFFLAADQRLEEASQVIAYLDQSGLNLPDVEDYTSSDPERAKLRSQYRAHLERVFQLLGENPQEAAVSAGNVLSIETGLASAALTELQRRDRRAWYHEVTLAQLRQRAPNFPWESYFSAAGVAIHGPMNVAVLSYVAAIDHLMQDAPMSVWRNYLRWNLVRTANPALPAGFRRAEFDFYSATLRGVKQEPSRTEQCGSLTSRDLGEAVGRVYVRKYFPPKTKQRVLDLVARVRQAMRDDVAEISWMSPATKKQMLEKLGKLRTMIGYPERWRDYSRLVIRRGDPLGNAFRAQEFETARQLAKIGKPVERGEFYELPQGVEGYHDNPLNVIVFTAGILQPPFFDPRMDDAISYGLAAAVIGHEITHAFDDKGHLFDGDGNMRNWWTPEDAKHYDQRAACFVRQYSGYTAVGDIKVNGELTLGENIADNGGLQLAWRAFTGMSPRATAAIDGYTPEQRFFLGWAQWRCMNASDKTAAIWARTNAHSPARWRVNGVVSNMPGFAQAYKCKAGDAMVNQEPCRIW